MRPFWHFGHVSPKVMWKITVSKHFSLSLRYDVSTLHNLSWYLTPFTLEKKYLTYARHLHLYVDCSGFFSAEMRLFVNVLSPISLSPELWADTRTSEKMDGKALNGPNPGLTLKMNKTSWQQFWKILSNG